MTSSVKKDFFVFFLFILKSISYPSHIGFSYIHCYSAFRLVGLFQEHLEGSYFERSARCF